jgi:regulator of protease activity HflC (stomatin/prohibitin superfamily)
MKESFSFGRILGISLLVFVVLILICTAFGSFYTIDQGERGIKLRYGAVVSVSEPGFHFKWPFIDDVKLISVRTETMHYQNMSAYSRDQQPAKIIASVTYRVPDSEVGTLYNQYQTVDAFVNRVINRQVPTQIENVFGQFNAITAVQDRARLIKELTDSVKASMKNDPIIIDSVQVENIIFSEAYEKSVESRMQAEVEVQTEKQKLDKEQINAQIVVARAKGVADSRLAEARAEAEATRIRGQAEADAIKARAAALAQNENLIELTKAERWDGKLPTTMLPNGAVPFLNMSKESTPAK